MGGLHCRDGLQPLVGTPWHPGQEDHGRRGRRKHDRGEHLRRAVRRRTARGAPPSFHTPPPPPSSTILATIFILPISFALEPPSAVMSCINAALAQGFTPATLWKHSLLAGAFYYLYNEVAFLALGRVNPVTHAVGNTIKRVVIIIASVIAFKTPISTLGAAPPPCAVAPPANGDCSDGDCSPRLAPPLQASSARPSPSLALCSTLWPSQSSAELPLASQPAAAAALSDLNITASGALAHA